jgi:hypothetical protein
LNAVLQSSHALQTTGLFLIQWKCVIACMANEPKQNNLSLNLAQQHPHTRRPRLLQFHNDSIKTPRRQRVKTMKHMFIKVELHRIHFSIDRL